MPLEKIRVLSVLVIAAVTSSLIAGEFFLLQFLIYVAISIPLWFPIDLDKVRNLPYWRILIFVGFVVFVGSRFIGFQFRNTLFFLILCCIVYEYYGEKRPKAPVRLISLLSFLFMLSQVRQNYGLSMLVSISIYLVAVIWCLINFHTGGIRRSQFKTAFAKRIPRALGHSVIIACIGLVVFWLIPRLPDQSMAVIGNLAGNRLSGFSDSVTLNDIGSLKLSRKHIMDLTPLDGKLHSRYLKGKVLDIYEDGIWTASSSQTHFVRSRNEFFQMDEMASSSGPTIRYRINLEPMQNNTMFFFNDIVGFSGKLKHLKISGGRNASNINQVQVFRFYPAAVTYDMVCAMEGSRETPLDYREKLLHIPQQQDFFKPLATSLVQQSGAETEAQKIETFMRYFLDQFKYTLEINNYNVEDPLREFLLNRKQGHCELFASSLVLLLRAENIPARLVTGFLVPQKHPAGDFYAVTEADAHAWVEVYQNNRWVTLDPTPPAVFLEPSFIETQLAYFNYLWRTKVILWDSDLQREFWSGMLGELKLFFEWFKKDGWQLLIFLLLSIALVWLISRKRSNHQTQHLSTVFRKLDLLLQKHFGPRPAQMGTQEWLIGLGLEPQLKKDLMDWIKRYYSHRFGAQLEPANAASPLLKQGKQLSSRVKKWRNGP